MNIEDMRHMYSALRLGLWGPYGQAKQAYFNLAKQNEIAEILRATAMGKKFKPTPFAQYHELFPTLDEAETLGTSSVIREHNNEKNMAKKAFMSLGGNAPAWLTSEMG